MPGTGKINCDSEKQKKFGNWCDHHKVSQKKVIDFLIQLWLDCFPIEDVKLIKNTYALEFKGKRLDFEEFRKKFLSSLRN